LGKFQQPQSNLSKLEQLHSSFCEIRNISINWNNLANSITLNQLSATGNSSIQIWAKWNSFSPSWVTANSFIQFWTTSNSLNPIG